MFHSVHELRLLLLAFTFVLFACGGQGQSLSEDRAVLAMASVLPGNSGISLQWPLWPAASSYTVQRRLRGATSWGAVIGTLPGSATGYVDATALEGVTYEYKVSRSSSAGMGHGYVLTGMATAPVEDRGILVLVVEFSLEAPLATSIAQLEEDLMGDGWFVERLVVDATASPSNVRSQIAALYNAAPRVKAVFLLGHVPVPYSGNQAPDGHGFHSGAWACDGYYGELNGNWTDASVNSLASNWAWNHNVPGDGKFDQNGFPSALELQVGRVDLSRLGVFPESEVELLEAYLAKAHAFKTGAFRVPERAVIKDDLQWTGYPLAVSALMAMAPAVGVDSIVHLDGSQPFAPYYQANDMLISFQAGAGIQGSGPSPFLGIESGLSTTQLNNDTRGGVFNLSIGSYFGDWDNPDNYLRALLAKGNGLAHVWSGLPNWFLHPMASGETIGYCALRSLNNSNTDYTLANGGWQGQNMGRVHLGLMGDPSLRLRYTAPPSALVATNELWYSTFSWEASPDSVDGYLIHRIDTVTRTLVRVTPEPVTGTSYTASTLFQPGERYMVRAIRQLDTPAGPYHDLSLGAMAVSSGIQLVDCAGVIGGEALPGTPCAVQVGVEFVYDGECVCGDQAIGIEELGRSSLRVWPSHANDRLHVRCTDAGGTLVVRATSGHEVHKQRMTGSESVVDIATWAAGTYIVEWIAPFANALPLRSKAVVLH